MKKNLIAALLFGATVLPALQGCFPMVAAGVTTGVLATVDRRSLGTQTLSPENKLIASFEVPYEPGELVALGYAGGLQAGHQRARLGF